MVAAGGRVQLAGRYVVREMAVESNLVCRVGNEVRCRLDICAQADAYVGVRLKQRHDSRPSTCCTLRSRSLGQSDRPWGGWEDANQCSASVVIS